MAKRGLLLVISGPSGTGKGTVLNLLRQLNTGVRYSISATTRQPREGEVDGQNYFFKTVEEFEQMIKEEELVEWVQYCGNYYGTPKKCIEETLDRGFDVILEIEVEGALNIKNKYPESVLIFILPPTFEELRRRIESRGTEEPGIISQRLEKAKKEFQFINSYDYAIVNNSLQDAVEDINSILRAEKLKFSRNGFFPEELGI